MAKEWAKAFYNSKKWQVCRDSYIAERVRADGGMCEVCRERLGYIVHHKELLTPYNINDPDVSLNHSNLRYECKSCHDKEEDHFKGGQTKPLCVFTPDGQPVSLRDIDRKEIWIPPCSDQIIATERPTANLNITHRSRV